MIEENTSFKMVKELCVHHNYKLNYDLRSARYSGVSNIGKVGLKTVFFTIPVLIYIKLTYSKL